MLTKMILRFLHSRGSVTSPAVRTSQLRLEVILGSHFDVLPFFTLSVQFGAETGELFVWGTGSDGQLGNNSTDDATLPKRVTFDAYERYAPSVQPGIWLILIYVETERLLSRVEACMLCASPPTTMARDKSTVGAVTTVRSSRFDLMWRNK